MTRKLLVRILACYFILLGLGDIVEFFLPLFTSQQPMILNEIVSGILTFWAGIYLFQLSEFGRKFAIIILFFNAAWGVIIGVIGLVFPFFDNKYGIAFRIRYSTHSEPIFESHDPYVGAISLSVLLLIVLGIILFLNHKKTRALFASKTVNAEDNRPISESISDQ